MKAIPKSLLACLLALSAPFAVLAAAPSAQAPATFGPHASGAVTAMPPADHASQPSKKKVRTPPNSVKLVDLNKASTQELMTLPGIGKPEAERIVANRPYQVKSDLVNKKVLPTGPYLAVRKRVVAPAGSPPETIHTESYGRAKVKFHWDTSKEVDDKASCWMRQAQLQTSGSMMLHRLDWEAVVEFHEMVHRHGKTPIEWLDSIGVLGPDLVIGHGIFLNDHPQIHYPHANDFERLRDSGASVAHCPTVFARRGMVMNSIGRYMNAGITVGIGTDTFPHNMLDEMRLAAYLARTQGESPRALTSTGAVPRVLTYFTRRARSPGARGGARPASWRARRSGARRCGQASRGRSLEETRLSNHKRIAAPPTRAMRDWQAARLPCSIDSAQSELRRSRELIHANYL